MSNTNIIKKKNAKKQLKDIGRVFVDDFKKNSANSEGIRSKEPCVCWKMGGLISYAVISEFSGPNSINSQAPTIFRIRVNKRPPVHALDYQFTNSERLRSKLGVKGHVIYSDFPVVEITATAEEVAKLGTWLPDWVEQHCIGSKNPPAPPVKLIARDWNATGGDKKTDFLDINHNWLDDDYLWSEKAIEQYDAFLAI